MNKKDGMGKKEERGAKEKRHTKQAEMPGQVCTAAFKVNRTTCCARRTDEDQGLWGLRSLIMCRKHLVVVPPHTNEAITDTMFRHVPSCAGTNALARAHAWALCDQFGSSASQQVR